MEEHRIHQQDSTANLVRFEKSKVESSPSWWVVDSMPFNSGFQPKFLQNPWSIPFHPAKVLLMGLAILFKNPFSVLWGVTYWYLELRKCFDSRLTIHYHWNLNFFVKSNPAVFSRLLTLCVTQLSSEERQSLSLHLKLLKSLKVSLN